MALSPAVCRRIRIVALVVSAWAVLSPAGIRADSPPHCKALENSPLAEPDWYAEQCLGRPAAEPGTPGRFESPNLPGDLFYIHNIRAVAPNPDSLVTAPLPTLNYALVGAQTRNIFAMDFDNTATTLWGIDSATLELGTYNLTTGAFTPTGAVTGITVGHNVTGMKFDPTSSNVYISSTSGALSQLYTLDLATRVATLVGPITGFNLVIDIGISNTGQIYGHDIGLDQLLTINKATGAGAMVGATGLNCNFAQGMDFDPSENKLYALAYLGGGVNRLAEVNLATGAFNVLVNGADGPENEGAVRVPAQVLVPSALNISGGNGNVTLEANEVVTMTPSWQNTGFTPITFTGVLSNFTGPAGPTYTITDATASYGTVAAGGSAACTDCYGLEITSAARPVQHWDATALETKTPTGTNKTWTLHVGESFTDVPTTNGFYRFIETLFHKGITGGCGAGIYCPASPTIREQMAVFVLVAKEGSGYAPPACSPPNIFNDVPETNPFCRWIEELSIRGVVGGCGGGNYCPADPTTREQMAVFVLRTLDPSLNPPDCAPPNIFNDVPETSPFCRWIEELANRGVVSGCGGGAYCPADPVSREQMGVFIAVTFGLSLYGP